MAMRWQTREGLAKRGRWWELPIGQSCFVGAEPHRLAPTLHPEGEQTATKLFSCRPATTRRRRQERCLQEREAGESSCVALRLLAAGRCPGPFYASYR